MQQNIENSMYKFIPHHVVAFNNIIKHRLVMENDIFEKYEATTEVSGELIICKDVSLVKHKEKKMERETYDDYLQTLSTRDPKKDKWIYNIIDGISEQESILFKDDLCIFVLNYLWDGKNIDKLQILCLPIDKSLRSIRSLDSSHIHLLEHMKKITLQIIREKYGLEEEYMKMFFHYDPSTYHLHIHFVNILLHEAHSSVEYSHELNNVLFNLSICSDYYKIINLNIRV
jgi:m7GpppX diphosphatase